MSEAKRGLLRIASNYTRLVITLVIGLVLVRMLLRSIGDDAYGVIAFLGSSTGLAGMLRDIVQRCMIRELGEAYHSGDDQNYIRTFNSAIVLTTIIGLLTLGLFGVLTLALRLMPVPQELLGAASWFTVFKGLQTFITVALSPSLNSYLISERMVAHNVWMVVERATWLIAAVGLLVFGITDPARGIVFLGLWTAVLISLSQFVAVGVMAVLDKRTRPRPWLASRNDIASILKIGGWNTAVVTALNLHERVDALIMFSAFGPLGGRLFGIAVQLTSYTRMVATGVTTGLDAVSTRFSSTRGQDSMMRLMIQSTRLHALVILPSITMIFVLCEVLLRLWVGDRLANPDQEIPMTATLIRIMCLGMFARSMSDGWIAILYGAGHIRRYAPLVLAGGIANPVVAVLLLLALPESARYTGPALAFSLALTLAHLFLFPRLAAKVLSMRYGDAFVPMLRPLLATLLCLPLLLVPCWLVERWNLLWLASVLAVYSAAYVPATYYLVLGPAERKRSMGFAMRKLGLKRQIEAGIDEPGTPV